MGKKSFVVIAVIVSLMVLVGCAKKAVREEPMTAGKAGEQAWGKPGEGTETTGIDEKSLQASLEKKKYPGIEGEFLESSLLKDVNFGFDRYDLTPKAREILSQNAELLLQHRTIKIQIEGHCDERGTIEYNLALGERRAESTRQYLISMGVPANRMSTISYGEEMPLDPRHDEEAWAKNRRAHFIILSR